MKQYVDCIEDYERCTKEDLIDVINQMSDKLNYLLNIVYNSPSGINNIYYNDLDR